MYAPKFRYSLAVICVVTLCGVGLVYSRMIQRIPRGAWGGSHINMNVGEESVTIEFDCAQGEISGPLTTEGDGKFQLRGTFTRERGGPVRADETRKGEPATYSGKITGNKMTLTMKLADSNESETFTLEKDKEGELFKCK